ncbi:MAG: DoxX family membrane protein [Phycisphaerales bacterium JB060]
MAREVHLTARQRTALSVPPLLLRLVLAIIFIWAGYAKIFGFMDVTPENRAALVAAGVLGEPAAETPEDQAPIDEPVRDPIDEPIDEPDPIEEPAPDPIDEPADEPIDPAGDPIGEPDPADGPLEDPDLASIDQPAVTLVAQEAQPQRVRKLNNLAVLLHKSANPPSTLADDDAGTLEAQRPMALWPAAIGNPPWPERIAWAAALTELIAGLLLLIGLFTRLGGLSIAVVMGSALWLTEIGPAIQSGNTWLWVLPMYEPMDISSYTRMLYQLSLLVIGLSLLFSGPGMLSLDRWIFGKGVADDED